MVTSFTTSYHMISRALRNKVTIIPISNTDDDLLSIGWDAIWDTGATTSVVSDRDSIFIQTT